MKVGGTDMRQTCSHRICRPTGHQGNTVTQLMGAGFTQLLQTLAQVVSSAGLSQTISVNTAASLHSLSPYYFGVLLFSAFINE